MATGKINSNKQLAGEGLPLTNPLTSQTAGHHFTIVLFKYKLTPHVNYFYS